MPDQPRYVDEDGNPVDASEIEAYEMVPAAPAARPAAAAASSSNHRTGGGGLKMGFAVIATAALVAGVGFAGIKAGVINLGAAPAAAPSAAATPTSETSSSTPSPTSSSSSPSSAAPSAAAEPVQVSNERYIDAKWGTPPVRRPGARLRITDGVTLPESVRAILDVPAAKAFDSFKPYTRIAMSAPDVLTVQTVARAGAGVRKPWSDVTVSIAGGKPVVKGEKSGDDSADSADLVDTDDAPEADTDGGVFQVEGDGIPESARGKRSGTVTVSTIKRDANANSGFVWIMVGDKLFRAVVEDASGGTAAGQDEEGK